MKKTIISAIVIAFVLVSCNQKNKQTETTNTPMMENDTTMMMKDSTMMENDTTMTMKDSKMTKDSKTKLYACPMHPEVQGKLNDKCSKCGMELNVEVK